MTRKRTMMSTKVPRRKGTDDKKDHEEHKTSKKGGHSKDDGKKDDSERKDGTGKKGGDADSKTVDEVKDKKKGTETSPALADGSSKTTSKPGQATMPTAGTTSNTAPLWLVQPFGASVWEQGRTYVISWGPNPDPIFTEGFKPKTPVNVHLMQGPHDNLLEVAVLKAAMDSSLNSLQWTVPATLAPSKDYSIRLSHEGDLDTYSHYFEVSEKGDPRSTKSNVGEPLQMPQKTADMGTTLPKGAINKPAAPPNPFPAEKTVAAKPAVTKPAMHSSANLGVPGESRQGANMMALAMALFGAVYFL
ncbi:hypothetical protein EMPS_03494 [Entomortierella parvispora]|uniref:Yeast cell wall synthesis Kre9/Knh1-like N-terminal domain-containing protein n=1 Tax=Entomortierella parvispora TaxID=205924 RepID=A0A9P3H6P2_9FUNG|nr:hypothetical protein EMPS_03494 [Entomortierella parvispora]